MNFQSKIVQSKNDPVYLVTMQAGGKPAWYYVKVDELKHNAFKKQLASNEMDITQFGTVLYSGWGTTPPEPIEALIKEQYEAA